jgi:membrane fusion protein, multidrug efflux system
MRNRIIAIGLLSFVLLASIIGIRWYSGKQKTQAAEPAIPLVATALAQVDKKAAKLSLTGTIEAFQETVVSSKTTGRVQQILVEDGRSVDAGQSLVILESREAENSVRMSQASVAQSLANLNDSRANYRRYQTLYEKGAVSEQQLSAAQTKMQVDEAQYQLQLSSLANAQEQLGNTAVVAPVAGYVANKSVVLGTVVSPGTPLMQVHDIASIYFTVSIQQKDIARLSVGQGVDITADAYPGRVFRGSVEIINPAAGQNSRLFKVKIKIPNTDLALKPGMFAKGVIALGAPRDVVTIPQSALWVKDGKSYVFTVDGTKVLQTPVNVGEIFNKTVEVSGIFAGTKVVTDGLHSIKDGDSVRLAN